MLHRGRLELWGLRRGLRQSLGRQPHGLSGVRVLRGSGHWAQLTGKTSWWNGVVSGNLHNTGTLKLLETLNRCDSCCCGRLLLLLLLLLLLQTQTPFLVVVDEMAPGTVGTETDRVIGSAEFSFVLGVTIQRTQFVGSVSKLALVSVLAVTVLLERPAQFSLVAGRIDVLVAFTVLFGRIFLGESSVTTRVRDWLADGAIKLAVVLHRGRGYRTPRDHGRS